MILVKWEVGGGGSMTMEYTSDTFFMIFDIYPTRVGIEHLYDEKMADVEQLPAELGSVTFKALGLET